MSIATAGLSDHASMEADPLSIGGGAKPPKSAVSVLEIRWLHRRPGDTEPVGSYSLSA